LVSHVGLEPNLSLSFSGPPLAGVGVVDAAGVLGVALGVAEGLGIWSFGRGVADGVLGVVPVLDVLKVMRVEGGGMPSSRFRLEEPFDGPMRTVLDLVKCNFP
jgi:hypothetical protein